MVMIEDANTVMEQQYALTIVAETVTLSTLA